MEILKMANKEIRDYPDFAGESNEGYLIVGGKTSSISGGKILLSDIGGGGSGGLSPITPTTIIPTLEDNVYKIIIPSNNAYYIATIDDTHNVEITPPTIGANEMYNVVLFVIANDIDEKQMTIAYDDYGIAPLDDESRYGYVHGHGFTQFILFGRGFTMKTAAYAAG